MASAARLNARVRRAERQVAALHEDELVRAYRAALGGLARDIADRFTYEATHTPVEALAAAGAPQSDTPPPPPRWVPPPGPALYAAVARAGAVKKIREVQEKILTAMQARVAIGFDVVGAPSQTLLDNLGARADEALSAAVREPVATAMGRAYREGDTIVEAARAIRAAVNDVKVWQAVMLARTDLIGISNGSSLLQARALNAAAPTPIITTKKWLATNDNRTRHTHREADGQEVPIDARFSVGNSQLDYPGDPHGSDSEVINCRCTVLLLEAPTKAALRAAGPWDETLHPRHPEGTSTGGRFAPKHGATGTDKARAEPPKTAAEAGRRIAASVLRRQRQGLEATVDEIRAMPIPTGEYAGETVYMENGGGSFNRLPDGRYIIDGANLNAEGYDPTRYATADEAIDAMRARLSRPELEAEVGRNWAKRLRGGVMNDREVLALVTAGDARNALSPTYRAFTEKWGVNQTPVIVLNEKGMQAFGKDILTSGFYDPGVGVVFLNGDSTRVGLDLIEKNLLRRPDGVPYDYGTRIGVMRPGGGSGGNTVDGLIRHETAHAAWANMPQQWRDEFTASVPADYETRATLTRYAADAPEVYAESMKGADAAQFPWQGEVHSEVVAATMDPEYDRTLWPPWVNEMGDRIRELQP